MYLPNNKAPHCGVQAFRTDNYSKPRSLRISYLRLGGLVEADRVPPCNLCPRLKCFVWDAGGGAEGRGGSEYSHTYSWRGGLRAPCYVWVMKSSERPPPNTHSSDHALGFHGGHILCPLIFIEGQTPLEYSIPNWLDWMDTGVKSVFVCVSLSMKQTHLGPKVLAWLPRVEFLPLSLSIPLSHFVTHTHTHTHKAHVHILYRHTLLWGCYVSVLEIHLSVNLSNKGSERLIFY